MLCIPAIVRSVALSSVRWYSFFFTVIISLGLPRGSVGKEFTFIVLEIGGVGSVPGLGRSPGEGHGNPLLYSCLENPMDSPEGHKESDTTKAPEHT